jgi:hypothetical protein
MNAREAGEAGVHRERVFELWDARASKRQRTEQALSNAMRIARNAVSSCSAKNARRIREIVRSPLRIKGKQGAMTCSP